MCHDTPRVSFSVVAQLAMSFANETPLSACVAAFANRHGGARGADTRRHHRDRTASRGVERQDAHPRCPGWGGARILAPRGGLRGARCTGGRRGCTSWFGPIKKGYFFFFFFKMHTKLPPREQARIFKMHTPPGHLRILPADRSCTPAPGHSRSGFACPVTHGRILPTRRGCTRRTLGPAVVGCRRRSSRAVASTILRVTSS